MQCHRIVLNVDFQILVETIVNYSIFMEAVHVVIPHAVIVCNFTETIIALEIMIIFLMTYCNVQFHLKNLTIAPLIKDYMDQIIVFFYQLLEDEETETIQCTSISNQNKETLGSEFEPHEQESVRKRK